MIPALIEIARHAGEKILEIYNSDFTVEYKGDSSPLTEADKASNDYISEALRKLGSTPIVSEEDADSHQVSHSTFWLVDPLDGTKEFLKRSGDFTVNIALVKQGRPVLGVVYVPARDWLYYGSDEGGAWKVETAGAPVALRTGATDPSALCIVASKDHAGPEVEALLQRLPGAGLASMGSSLKFCLVAEGKADLYPRFGPTMEWDTAAAHAVLSSAGGAIYELDGSPLLYNKPGFKNGAFVAVGDRSFSWKSLLSQ
jgi:3'(2'), 5'-bisphosphate nucleotidase